MKSAIPYFLFTFLILSICQSQSISGRVVDKNTGEPVAFANVFCSGTMLGAVTDLEGNFSFDIVVDGKYELIVSYVGYHKFAKQIISSNGVLFLEVELEPEVIQLRELRVKADTVNWEKNYKDFKPLFLGRSRNAAKVEILNPKDIFLFYDEVENGLYAHARKEIVIDNQALGFQVGYQMQEFGAEYGTGNLTSFGIPRFEELEAKSKRQQKNWRKARLKSYNGSFNHFLKSFKDNTFYSEGFRVQELYKVENPERPPEEIIEQKISFFKEKLSESGRLVIGKSAYSDSLRAWSRIKRMPLKTDSLGREYKSNSLINGDTLLHKGYLRVTYLKEREELVFAQEFRPGGIPDKKQTSDIFFSDYLKIYENGYYDVEKILFSGYMAWSSSLAEMLPLEFKPN